jgi:hypothetical protein
VIRVETYGLGEWAAQLQAAGKDITKQVAKTTGMACNNMKKDAKRRVDGYAHLPHLGRSFTYDVKTSGTTVTGQVGAEHERPQGKLDVFIEFGTPTSAPIPHWAPAADKEVPVWTKFLERIAAEALGD